MVCVHAEIVYYPIPIINGPTLSTNKVDRGVKSVSALRRVLSPPVHGHHCNMKYLTERNLGRGTAPTCECATWPGKPGRWVFRTFSEVSIK